MLFSLLCVAISGGGWAFVTTVNTRQPTTLFERKKSERPRRISSEVAKLGREFEDLLSSRPLLSAEEEVRLGEAVQAYVAISAEDEEDDAKIAAKLGYGSAEAVGEARREGKVARNELMLSNMRLVVSLATKAHRGGGVTVASSHSVDRDGGALSLGDLVAEGVIGLATAVDRFDPSKGFRFSTYATWWIRSSIQNALQCKTVVKVPVLIQQYARHVRNTTENLQRVLGRRPTSAELAFATGLSTQQISMAQRAAKFTVSLDMPLVGSKSPRLGGSSEMIGSGSSGMGGGGSARLGGGEASLGDFVESTEPAPDDAAEFHELRDTIDSLMVDRLKPKERDILRLRLGLDDGAVRTRLEVGQIFGQSVKNVRNIERSAINKLRKNRSRFEGLDLSIERPSKGF